MDIFEDLLRSAMVERGLSKLTLDGNQNINNNNNNNTGTTSETLTSDSNLLTTNNTTSKKSNRKARRQNEWIKKCVSNFSLYSTIVGNNCDDPYEEAAAIEAGEFKVKMSKSAKKRLRRQKKTKKLKDNKVHGPKAAQMKKLNLALAKKQTKKDIKLMINKLSNLPL